MTRQKTRQMVQILGGIGVVLSLFCLCGNLLTVAQMVSMGSMGSAMKSLQENVDRQKAVNIAQLEKKLEQAQDEQEREQIQDELDRLKDAPDAMKVYFDMMNGPRIKIVSGTSAALGLLGNLLLMAGGIGLLLVAPWGRMLSLVAAVVKIATTIISQLLYAFFILPMINDSMRVMMDEMAGSMGPGGPPPQMFGDLVQAFGAVQAVATLILVSIFPVVLLVLLNRKDVKRLLRGEWPEEEASADDDLAPRDIRDY